MPIWDVQCQTCETVFEYLEISSDDYPQCPYCGGSEVKKIFTTCPHIRMNSDDILHTLPDPIPPLRELIGKGTGGFKELEQDQRELKDYTRTKDKQGNSVWLPKERKYFYGKGQSKGKEKVECKS